MLFLLDCKALPCKNKKDNSLPIALVGNYPCQPNNNCLRRGEKHLQKDMPSKLRLFLLDCRAIIVKTSRFIPSWKIFYFLGIHGGIQGWVKGEGG